MASPPPIPPPLLWSLFAARICCRLLPFFVILRLAFVIICHPYLSLFVALLTPSSAVHSHRPPLAFVILLCPLLSMFAALVFDKICMLARQQKSYRSTVGGGIHRQKTALTFSPAQTASYATSRCIELGLAQVRLRRRQMHGGRRPRCGKKFPLFFKPMKKYTYLTISKQTKRPQHRIRCDEQAHPVRTGAGVGLRRR
jgi:hypothetical protein